MTFHRNTVCRMARILCIAAAFSLLIGCTAASPSSSNKAAVSGGLAQPDTDSILVIEGDGASSSDPSGEENGLAAPALDALEEALDTCLGWGPGSAGSSLHSVAAAAALLDWAAENDLSGRTDDPAADAFDVWYAALDEFDKDTFAETWPLVCDEADALLEDADGMAERMETAGVSPERADGWTSESWEALRAAVDGGSGR